MAIDARAVKELRDITGLPMILCKQALEATGGDVEAAKERLRKQGEKVMESKAGRTTKEGRVAGFVTEDGRLGFLLSLRCETEPVARCEDFVGFLASVIEAARAAPEAPQTPDEVLNLRLTSSKTVRNGLLDLVNKIRENIHIGDVRVLRGDAIFQYLHFDNRHGSMTALKGVSASDPAVQEAGKNLCMHVVFARPAYLVRGEVPPDVIDKEREILLAAQEHDPKIAQKPPEVRRKIVEGQLNAFFKEKCLLEQPFVRDDKTSVEKYAKQQAKGATISGYAYLGLAS